jgi:hypothetical protein
MSKYSTVLHTNHSLAKVCFMLVIINHPITNVPTTKHKHLASKPPNIIIKLTISQEQTQKHGQEKQIF